jgi:hypothetical protein
MAEPVPIACSLDGAQLSDRAALVAELGRSLSALEANDRQARLRFTSRSRGEVAAFVRAESACCPFFEFGLVDEAGGVTLEVAAPEGGEWAVRGLVVGFIAGWAERPVSAGKVPAMKDSSLGREFAEALARKDFQRIGELLDPQVDFRGLTPNRNWEASSPAETVSNVMTQWFEDSDHIDELIEVQTGAFADRQQMTYSFRGHNEDGPFVVEQQAYFTERDGRIAWMRVLCSGFRPG